VSERRYFGSDSGSAEYDHAGYDDGYRSPGNPRGTRQGGGRHSRGHQDDDGPPAGGRHGGGPPGGGRHSGSHQDGAVQGGGRHGGYQGDESRSNGSRYQSNGYQTNGYQRGGYQADGEPDSGYQSDGYQSNGYQTNGYQSNEYQSNGYQSNGYQSAAYQDDSYRSGSYRDDSYRTGAHQDAAAQRAGYQAGAYEAQRDGYQGGYQRGGYQDGAAQRDAYQAGAYRGGAHQGGAHQDGAHQDGGPQREGYPGGGHPDGASRGGAYPPEGYQGGAYQDGAARPDGHRRDSYPDGYPDGGYPDGGYHDDGYQEDGFFGGGGGGEPVTRAERRRGRPDRPRRRRGPLVPVLAIVLVIGLLAGGYYGGRRALGAFGGAPADYAGAGTGSVLIQVHDGDTATDIATTLVQKGVVKTEKAFRNAAKGDARSAGIQPGFYKLHKQMSAASALTLLLDPIARVLYKITIPEGLSVAAILARLSKATSTPVAQLQAAAKDTAALGLPDYAKGRLEGFLWPATYKFDPGTEAATMLKKMVATYRSNVDASGLSAQAAAANITPYEMVTVASLIEAEGKTPDFTKISRVVYNRLDAGQRLEFDSTVNYAMNGNAVAIKTKQLNIEINSPYNTYNIKGLPPGPISNPGANAIKAALHPAQGPWLYFVVKDKAGNSYFTADFQDFQTHKQAAIAAGLF
jgi:UPF0755 protein